MGSVNPTEMICAPSPASEIIWRFCSTQDIICRLGLVSRLWCQTAFSRIEELKLAELVSHSPYHLPTDSELCGLLRRCSGLQTLDLSTTPFGHLFPMAASRGIYTVDLAHCFVQDISLMVAFSSLETLDLSGTAICSIAALKACPNLQALSLAGALSLSDISELRNCTSLLELDIARTAIWDLSSLASCSQLEILDISGTPVRDISPISACSNLLRVNLANTLVSKIASLKNCRNLEQLDASNTHLCDSVSLSQYLPQLKFVEF